MRALSPVPENVLDTISGRPRYGSYRGGVRRVDLAPIAGSRLARVATEKRWMYVGIATADLYVAVAIVRLGYVASTFGFAYDARQKRMLAEVSKMAPPFACEVGDSGGEGCLARFAFAGSRASVVRAEGASAYSLDVQVGPLVVHARLDAGAAPPPVTAIAALGDRGKTPLVNVTEKRALLAVSGEARLGGERRSLDGALGGYDYTHGLLPRRTAWRWAFLLGRAKSGEKVAVNLVGGFVGEAECAAWVDGELFGVGEGRFTFDANDPLAPWTIASGDGAVDLAFAPGAMHAEKTNLGVVASRFVQPAGVYSGTLRVAGKELAIDGALGVAEDQDTRW